MRQQIVDLVNARGEMTFRELCDELNMFSQQEVEEMATIVYSMDSGTEDCPECSGDGTIECGACSGEGHWVCDDCGGKGSVDCDECEGDGVVEIDGKDQDCDLCEDGELECEECENGMVYCDECDDGTNECDFCDGYGEVDSEKAFSIVIVGPQSLIGSSIIKPRLTGVDQ